MNGINDIDDDENLRSEKVRKLLGEIPSSLTLCGMVIIVFILATLTAIVCLVPYPYSDGESIIRHLIRLCR